MTYSQDHLYELLPVIHRVRDAEQGYPLRALLRVVTEQVKVVEDDVAQLYDNWFIETCQDWLVPYVGDLVGYQPVHEAGEPGEATTPQSLQRNKILIPRREVANTIYYRRRKGTLALLELLSQDVAGWPARAVEFYKLLGWTQHLNHQRLGQGRTVDLRNGEALDQLDGPFDELAHTVEVRRIASQRGRYNIPGIGIFVWRLRPYAITQAPAYRLDEQPHCFTFSIAGNDVPLYNRPQPEAEPTHIAEELNLPTPIRRRRFETHKADYYGEGKSLVIWTGKPMTIETVQEASKKPAAARTTEKTGLQRRIPANRQIVLPERIVPANLRDWQYEPEEGYVAVDPELGRLAFSPSNRPADDELVWVTYHHGFSADIGGGEYDRALSQPLEYTLYRVGEREQFTTITDALQQWENDLVEHSHAIIEITDNQVYEERLVIVLKEQQSLQLRAANRTRPVLSLTNIRRNARDAVLSAQLAPGSRLTLDGLTIIGGAVQLREIEAPTTTEPELGLSAGDNVDAESVNNTPPVSATEKPSGDNPNIMLAEVIVRHSTLVPGWLPECDRPDIHHHEHQNEHHFPHHHAKPSLFVETRVCIAVEHSIAGAIVVSRGNEPNDPGLLCISDSILDATLSDSPALVSEGKELIADTVLKIARSTVIGEIHTHAIELAENCIFDGHITVARSQLGCMRFCYITPDSRTPQRYECQPELAEQRIEAKLRKDYAGSKSPEVPTKEVIDTAKHLERERAQPRFISKHYGTPTYCQLAETCVEEITHGAEDESEMGVFHDLYQPQRDANLRTRLNEYTPAGMEVGVLYAN